MIEVLLVKVVSVVATVAVPTLTFMGSKYLNRRWKLGLSQQEQEQIFELAKKSVMFSDQKFKSVEQGEATNRDKLKEATRFLMGSSTKMGLKIDEAEAERMIESALNLTKRESGQYAPAVSVQVPSTSVEEASSAASTIESPSRKKAPSGGQSTP